MLEQYKCLFTPFEIGNVTIPNRIFMSNAAHRFYAGNAAPNERVLHYYEARATGGAGLIITAVLITTRMKPPKDRTRRQLLAGIMLGVVNMALMAIGIVIAKPVLEHFPMIWATALRMAAGTIALVFIILALPQRKTLFSAFKPSKQWKLSIPGSMLGAYLACIFWIGGFKYTDASVAAILNQTSTDPKPNMVN